MTGHIPPESTNACSTSPTTDQPELLNEAREFFAVECEKHGFSSQAVAVRAGDISYEDGGQVCIDAMVSFARHRLTSTTPTLGGMVDREQVARAVDPEWWKWFDRHGDFSLGNDKQKYDTRLAAADRVIALFAAPASPIPTSVNGAGERERLIEADERATRLLSNTHWQPSRAHYEGMRNTIRRAHEALSPALDNTAECASSPDGRHQVDTSLESGPNNCFHCSAQMGGTHAR